MPSADPALGRMMPSASEARGRIQAVSPFRFPPSLSAKHEEELKKRAISKEFALASGVRTAADIKLGREINQPEYGQVGECAFSSLDHKAKQTFPLPFKRRGSFYASAGMIHFQSKAIEHPWKFH